MRKDNGRQNNSEHKQEEQKKEEKKAEGDYQEPQRQLGVIFSGVPVGGRYCILFTAICHIKSNQISTKT